MVREVSKPDKAPVARAGVRGVGRPRKAGADDAILDAVVDLLGRVGYGDLRMEQVATRAGVARSTVYRRWPTKVALVSDAVERLYLTTIDVPDAGSLRDDLVVLLTGSYQLLASGAGRVLERLVRDSGSNPELARIVAHTIAQRRRLYQQVLNRGIARGELPASVDQGLVMDLLQGPLWVRLLVTGGPIGRRDVPAVVDAVLAGVAGVDR